MLKVLLSCSYVLYFSTLLQAQSRAVDLIFGDNFENHNSNTTNWSNPVAQFQWEKVTRGTFPKDDFKINIPLNSTGSDSTWMMLDAFKDGAGDDEIINSRLTTPELDLSKSNQVFLKFDNLYRKGNDRVFIEVTKDKINWIPIELYKNLKEFEFPNQRQSPHKVRNPVQVILDLTTQLANAPKAWIAFRYEKMGQYGNSWQIDNVEVRETDPTPKCDVGIVDDAYSIAPNCTMPKSQVEPMPFLLNVENRGAEKLSDIKVEVNIFDENKKNIFHEELKINKLDKGMTEILNFNKTFMPNLISNSYIGEYKVTSTCKDELIDDNIYRFKFSFNEQIFQKEEEYTRVNSPAFDENELPKWEWGNFYHAKKGKNLKATAITFGYQQNDSSIANDNILVKLFKWNNSNRNQAVEPEELTLVGKNAYIFKQGDTHGIIKIVLYDPVTNTKSVQLEDSTTYFAVVEYQPKSTSGGMGIYANDTMFYHSTEQAYDFVNRERYTSALKIGNDKNYDINCFDYQMVPVIRLNVESSLIAAQEVIKNDVSVNVFPNPTSHQINIESSESAFFTKVKIQNLLGQTLLSKPFSNQIDVSFLQNGIYHLIIEKENALIIKKINVLK